MRGCQASTLGFAVWEASRGIRTHVNEPGQKINAEPTLALAA